MRNWRLTAAACAVALFAWLPPLGGSSRAGSHTIDSGSRTTEAFTQQGGGGGRRGGGPSGGPIGGTLTPEKADARGWGWQVKATMNPATPRPLYNRAKERLLQDRQITSYTISSYDPELYCESASTTTSPGSRCSTARCRSRMSAMIAACPRAGATR